MKLTLRNISNVMALAAIFATTACDSLIYDNLKDCSQELVFQFYRQTPCETQPYYPVDLKDVRLFVFDEQQILTEEYAAADLTLTSDYKLVVPFDHQGDFTFVAWGAGDMADYDESAFTKGVTTKDQLTMTLKHAAGEVAAKPSAFYFGEQNDPVGRHYTHREGSHSDSVAINMQEMYNRINLTVYGLDSTVTYNSYIADTNDSYDFEGNRVEGRPEFIYSSQQDQRSGILRSRFTTLKLEENRGTRLVIENAATHVAVFDVKLVDELIMYRGIFGEPPYSLQCDHDFNVVVVLTLDKTTGTYMCIQAVVNDWNVVKRAVTPY